MPINKNYYISRSQIVVEELLRGYSGYVQSDEFAGRMFADTAAGAHASATLYSIVETAKANKIDPYQYLGLIFTELPKISEGGSIEHLLQWNLTPALVH